MAINMVEDDVIDVLEETVADYNAIAERNGLRSRLAVRAGKRGDELVLASEAQLAHGAAQCWLSDAEYADDYAHACSLAGAMRASLCFDYGE